MTHLEVQHKADIFKRQIIQRSASLFSNPVLVLKGFLTSFPISTSRPWSHFSLCDRRFAPGLEFPNSRILPYSFIYCWGFPTLFQPFTTICSPCSVIFFSLCDLNYFLFFLQHSCFSINLFILLCVLFCFCFAEDKTCHLRHWGQALAKCMYIRLGMCIWTGMDTHEGREGRKPKMNIGFERELIHS